MKHARGLRGGWILLSVVVVILIAVHGIVFYRLSSHISSHIAWTILLALVLLVLLKHIGLFGTIYGLFKNRSRSSR